jgi:hypothetical protein
MIRRTHNSTGIKIDWWRERNRSHVPDTSPRSRSSKVQYIEGIFDDGISTECLKNLLKMQMSVRSFQLCVYLNWLFLDDPLILSMKQKSFIKFEITVKRRRWIRKASKGRKDLACSAGCTSEFHGTNPTTRIIIRYTEKWWVIQENSCTKKDGHVSTDCLLNVIACHLTHGTSSSPQNTMENRLKQTETVIKEKYGCRLKALNISEQIFRPAHKAVEYYDECRVVLFWIICQTFIYPRATTRQRFYF